MPSTKRPRKAYRPRIIAANNLGIALHRCAKPHKDDRAEVLAKLDEALSALRAGVATELDWSIAAGGVSVAKAIERLGVVRGLSAHLATIEEALQAIYDRCSRPHIWLRPTLSLSELDAMHLLLELHTFQVGQLSRSELIAAIDMAQKQIRADGHTSTVVRDIERMAA